MHPEEPTRKQVKGSRISNKGYQDCDQEIDAAPEPAIPCIFSGLGTGTGRRGYGPGGFFRAFFYYEYIPSTEVQDFRNKASKQYDGWYRPPIGIYPDIHCRTSP
jgi:hypothetical protein